MIISKKHKFVFFHVPKTGGTSVRDALKPHCAYRLVRHYDRYLKKVGVRRYLSYEPIGHHASYRAAEDYFDGKLSEYYTFCVVRNPFSWLFSHYKFILNRPSGHPYREEVRSLGSFRNFLNWPDKQNIVSRSQFSYVSNHLGQIRITKVLKFENLKEDLDEVSRNLGLPLKLEFRNRSQNDPLSYRPEYSAEMREVVFDRYKDDFQAFGYDF